MNNTMRFAAAAALLVPVLGAGAREPQAKAQPENKSAQAKPVQAKDAPNNKNSDGSLKVVVHNADQTRDNRDSRAQVGAAVVSASPWHAPTYGPAPEGLVAVPANTLGPGESLWRISDIRDAQVKLAQSEADYARAVADRAETPGSYVSFGYGYTPYSYGAGGVVAGPGPWNHGPRGRVVTTVTPSDTLGSNAQREFADAARPRIAEQQEARDQAVRAFGKNATPPIARIQNDVDRAHTRANTEKPVAKAAK